MQFYSRRQARVWNVRRSLVCRSLRKTACTEEVPDSHKTQGRTASGSDRVVAETLNSLVQHFKFFHCVLRKDPVATARGSVLKVESEIRRQAFA
jgi:hypothetical protein